MALGKMWWLAPAAALALAAAAPARANDQSWSLVTTAYSGIKYTDWSVPALADIDADGDLDLFVGNGSSISFYRNDGTTQAPVWTLVTDAYAGFTTISDYPGAAFGDLDGDGDLDMVISVIGAPKYHFRNDGTSAEAVWTLVTDAFVPTQYPGCSHVPTFADIDADGDLDFFDDSCDWVAPYWENVGGATSPMFELRSTDYVLDAVGLPGYGDYLVFEDIDLDGDLDLLASDASGKLAYLRNMGTASAPLWKLQTTDFRDIYNVVPASYGYIFPAFGDLDGDGYREVVMGDLDGNLSYFENKRE